jgi:alkaline phosphatase
MKHQYLLTAAVALGVAGIANAATPTCPTNAAGAIPGVKNIIVIINDGGGPTVYDATRMYLGHPLVTDGAAFKKTFVSTYPLREDSVPNSVYSTEPTVVNGVILNNNFPIVGRAQQAAVVYDTAKFWDTTPVAGASKATGYGAYPAGFMGYEWSRFAHPDSGNTATSIASGVRSYNNAINVDGSGVPVETITDLIFAARCVGKATGVVSTVQFGDATPAALGGAHNTARANRTAIADEMFSSGKLDVIGGTGNPDFNDDNTARTPAYTWVTSQLWADLKNNTNASGKNPFKFTLLQDKVQIDAVADRRVKPPAKLAMIMKADQSSQYNRSGANTTPTQHSPYNPALPASANNQPFNANIPTHAKLTIAALNRLDQNGRGFYLMSEAGAVDRAEHGNSTGRMIEEQIASDNTVQAIIDWVNRADTSATWDNTLLIITADHDHVLYGPQSATVPFQPLKDNGPGVVPGNLWLGPNHGTGLVPLFAYGKGAEAVVALATKVDDTGVDLVNPDGGKSYHLGNGHYVEQPTLGIVLKATAPQLVN